MLLPESVFADSHVLNRISFPGRGLQIKLMPIVRTLLSMAVIGGTAAAQTDSDPNPAPPLADVVSGIVLLQNQQQHGLPGVARPVLKADLPVMVSSPIREVLVREGQFVQAGTPLITLDDRIPRANLESAEVTASLTGALRRAEIEVKTAERRLQRLQSIAAGGAAAVFELEAAADQLKAAEAQVQTETDQLRAAEANRKLAVAELERYQIRAPFDGVIVEFHQTSGVPDLTRPVVTMANLSELEVELHAPIQLFGSLSVGDEVALSAGSPVARELNGQVVSVSPLIDHASATFRCLIRIPNQEQRLPAGFSIVLDPEAEPTSAGSSPRTAQRSFSAQRRTQ